MTLLKDLRRYLRDLRLERLVAARARISRLETSVLLGDPAAAAELLGLASSWGARRALARTAIARLRGYSEGYGV